MSDRELLEMAAKAAGIGPVIGYDFGELVIGPNSNKRHWNSLSDDGAALRLAVMIGFEECIPYIRGALMACDIEPKGDRQAATRRGITLAAAEIGSRKP